MNFLVNVSEIEWDTDGEEVDYLPESVDYLEVDEECDVIEALTEKYGWLVKSCLYEKADCLYASTDKEVFDLVANHLKETICYCSASFLSDHTDLPEEIFVHLGKTGFDKPEVYLRMVKNFDDMVQDMIDTDGPGKVLNSVDGKEYVLSDGTRAYLKA